MSARSSAHRLLAALLLLCLMTSSMAALFDRTRGMQTRGLHEEEQAEVLRKHGHEAQANKHLVREALEEHPDVQRFLEWKEKRQAGHAGVGAAFAGKIPHEYLPFMTHNHKEGKAEL